MEREGLHYLDLEVGLEVGLTAQRRQRIAPKGVQRGLCTWGRFVWGCPRGGGPGGEGCTWVWEEHILLPKAASPRRLWLQGPLCACSVHAHAHVGRNRAKGMYEYSEGRRAFGRHGRLNCLGREL